MKPVIITLGDPSGIGPEVVLRSLELIDPRLPVWLVGDWNLAQQTLQTLGMATFLRRIREEETDAASGTHLLIDVAVTAEEHRLEFGVMREIYGRVALESIETGLRLMERGLGSALVTAPIHKQALSEAGCPFPGHTELLAHRAGLTAYGRDYAMYFDSPTLKVVLLSVHVPLSEAILRLSAEQIAALAGLTHQEYGNFYEKKPRIGVAGLNPHAGEGGMFGEEEMEIARGVDRAASQGMSITGPHPADTIFRSAREGEFDVVMAMYHDQGLIPVKTLHFEESVNVTLGLPYLRCSVDHGTAFDIAGKGVANARPMAYAIEWAAKHGE
ncbi:MAG TPA: 4-hydroxythreonine-4-phosphate dehydrogenase PdxA [Thermoanaerobaculia bacterium]|nr:4-hydroxythreonine-4-phosphate dehydrogenase PdxA [Thermoanaerobaculia bacterium]